MKTYFTRTLLSILFLLLIHTARAQEPEPFKAGRLYLKLNAVNVFPSFLKDVYILDRGFIIEPAVKIGLSNRLLLNMVYGYCKVGKNPIYENFDYTNEGNYYKGGFEYLFLKPRKARRGVGLSAGLNGTYTKFNESGNAVVKSAYFGNLEKPFAQSNLEAFTIEHSFNIWFVMSKRFTLLGQVRANWVTSQSQNEQFPVYYIPGAGLLWRSGNARATDKSVNLTGGLSLQLFYRLF